MVVRYVKLWHDLPELLLIGAIFLAWWWLFQPWRFRSRAIRIRVIAGIACIVVLTVWGAGRLFRNSDYELNPLIAFAALALAILKLTFGQPAARRDSFICWYAIAAAIVVMASGYFSSRGEDLVHFSMLWLLGTAVFACLNVRLDSIRPKPINWLRRTAIVVFWIGILAALATGVFITRSFLVDQGLEAAVARLFLGPTFSLISIGIVSLSAAMELIASPRPSKRRLIAGFFLHLTWFTLAAVTLKAAWHEPVQKPPQEATGKVSGVRSRCQSPPLLALCVSNPVSPGGYRFEREFAGGSLRPGVHGTPASSRAFFSAS
jgi:hypothetical protein